MRSFANARDLEKKVNNYIFFKYTTALLYSTIFLFFSKTLLLSYKYDEYL